MAHILVTGGAGYIGAHVVRELLKNNHSAVVIDDLSTGRKEHLDKAVTFVEGDYGNESVLKQIFVDHAIDAVVHMAASIEVGESVEKPIEYLENNTIRTHHLLKAMTEAGVKKLIFSSTAAVYGIQEKVPISEEAPVSPLDPYGYSKLICEHLIRYYSNFTGLQAVIFRYFNACGSDFDKTIYSAHESHLIPYVMDVASGRRPQVKVFGSDYNTIDGTGVRDYVHVLDIARAHLAGLNFLDQHTGVSLFNIGTGNGLSVLQIIEAARAVTGKEIAVEMAPRRPGDSPITVADNAKIKRELGFELAHSDIETIIKTSDH